MLTISGDIMERLGTWQWSSVQIIEAMALVTA
jgi:hypothetical protein